MRLYAIVWYFFAVVWDSNAKLWDCDAMLCYVVCGKIYAWTDCKVYFTWKSKINFSSKSCPSPFPVSICTLVQRW